MPRKLTPHQKAFAQMEEDKRKGRPTKYCSAYDNIVMGYYLLGATDEQVAEYLGIGYSTYRRWLSESEELRAVRARGREEADAHVAQSLYKRATGYTQETCKIMVSQGEPVIVPHLEHVAPDTKAAQWWLKNRHPNNWRDKKEVALTGKDDGPVDVNHIIDADAATQTYNDMVEATKKQGQEKG